MRLKILKVLLWFVCLTHVALGVAGIFSPAAAVNLAQWFYGAHLDLTPAIVHFLRILGVYKAHPYRAEILARQQMSV